MSDVITVHDRNPDPLVPNCRVLNLDQDGVVFHPIEPLEGHYCFVGRTALHTAIGKLYGLEIRDVIRALGEGTQAQEKKLARERDRADNAEAEVRRLKDLIGTLVAGVDGADG